MEKLLYLFLNHILLVFSAGGDFFTFF